MKAFLLLLLAAPAALAQAPLSESIEVRVVNVEVSVLDRGGKPVTGLTRDDFEVLEDGERQPITNFHAVVRGTAAKGETEPEERFRRRILVLFDEGALTRRDRDRVLARLDQFARDGGDAEWSIMSITSSGLRVVLRPTTDSAAVRSAMASLGRAEIVRTPITLEGILPDEHPVPLTADLESLLGQEQTLKALIQMGYTTGAIAESLRAFAGVPGRKSVLLVSSSLSAANRLLSAQTQQQKQLTPRQNHELRSPAQMNDFRRLEQNKRARVILRDVLVREANASNASIYVLSPQGLDNKQFESAGHDPMSDEGLTGVGDVSAIYWLAEKTGGRMMRGNSIDDSIARFDVASANFYSIGYSPKRASDRHYHRIEVKLRGRSSHQLHYREGYAELPSEEQLERALRSYVGVAMQESTLPVLVEAGVPTVGKESSVVPLKASVPMDRLTYLPGDDGSKARVWLYVSVFDASGRFVTLARFAQDVTLQKGEQPTGRMVFHFPGIALRKGSYRLVVAVRDEIAQEVGITATDVEL